jgi:lipoprotein-releasing system permease protein
MSFSFFISKKYTVSKQDSRFITFISSISIVGIALGVAAVIISLSILNGFEKTITDKVVDFDSHIQILSYSKILPDYHTNLQNIEGLLGNYKADITLFAIKKGIIKSRTSVEGINVKGISLNGNTRRLSENIVEGEMLSPREDNILIGRKLANKLQVKTGDKLTVFALNQDRIPTPEDLPNIKRYVISGIFESGMAQYDDLNVYVPLESSQDLFNIGDNINGYDIRINNITKIDSLTDLLNSKLRYPHYARSIYQSHRNIFTWIELQKKPIPIVLGLIIIVAVFNIIGTLLMTVLEKTSAIGLLKSLGATKKQIIKIFIYQGIFLAAAGIIIGNLLAYLLLFLQLEFNIISLPSSVYFVSTVPIEISLLIFAGVSAVTFILALGAALIPSYIASKVLPISSLRFQ